MPTASGGGTPRRRIVDARPGRIRLEDVAAAAGVSAMTVSRVFHSPERVSRATQRSVRAAVAALGYVPHGAASALASRRSRIVAAVVPTLLGSVYGSTIEGLSAALRAAGYELMLGHSDFDPAAELSLVRAFVGRRVDALVLTGVEHASATVRLIRRHLLPVAEIWDLVDAPLGFVVGFSNVAAGEAAGTRFAALGRRRWAYLGTSPDKEHRSRKRLEGFRRAAAQCGLRSPATALVADGMDMAAGYAATRRLLARKPRVDALFCGNDGLACAALAAANDAGIGVPRDLALIGLGDFDVAAQLRPALTTLRIPGYRIGRTAAERLLELLAGSPRRARQVDLGFEMVVRDSA